MSSPRGKFHLFACRSGEAYAKKIIKQLTYLTSKRFEELQIKEYYKFEEQEIDELRFINHIKKHARLGKAKVKSFQDGELDVMLDPNENVRGGDVYLIQNHVVPENEDIQGRIKDLATHIVEDIYKNNSRTLKQKIEETSKYLLENIERKNKNIVLSENLMESMVYIDALKTAKANRVTLVSLYYPFGRGDKQHGKDGIPASLAARLLTKAGMSGMISMDLHADQIQGFFDPNKVEVDHLHGSSLFIEYLNRNGLNNVKIASPDEGGVKRANYLAKALKKKLLVAYKNRSHEKEHEIEELHLLGKPNTQKIITVDDIVGSAETVKELTALFQSVGITQTTVLTTHPLLIKNAVQILDKMYSDKNNPFNKLVGIDSIPQSQYVLDKPWFKQIDSSRYVADTIRRIHTSSSVSKLHSSTSVKELGLWVE